MYAQIATLFLMPEAQHNWLARNLTNHNSFKAFLEPMIQLVKPGWQAQGFAAKVIQNRVESPLVYSLVLQPSKSWPAFQAGQYLEIQIEIDGVQCRRIFSISTAPIHHRNTRQIELTIRRQDNGKVTNWMAEHVTTGQKITISQARGDFTLPMDDQPLLLIAGGSGITPMRSFLQQLAHQQPHANVHLLYYNQATPPLFADEWPALQQNMKNLQVSHIDTAQAGLITMQQLAATCPDFSTRSAYICGPHGLITTSQDLLRQAGVNENDIHHELFGPINQGIELAQDGQVFFRQSNSRVMSSAEQAKSLLELAESANLQPASGCRMGICHQCKCRKKQGIVYNTLTQQYSDTGTEDIQLCVSVAVGNVTLEL